MRSKLALSLLTIATTIHPISFRDYYSQNRESVDEQIASGRLNLDAQNLSALDGLNEVPAIDTLCSLMLAGNRLARIPAAVTSLPQLEYWAIDDNPITILYALAEIRKRDSFKISIYTPEMVKNNHQINQEACSIVTDDGDASACALEEAFAQAAKAKKKVAVAWHVYINWGEATSNEQEAAHKSLLARMNKVINLINTTTSTTGKKLDVKVNFGLTSGNGQGPTVEQEMYRRSLQAFIFERLSH